MVAAIPTYVSITDAIRRRFLADCCSSLSTGAASSVRGELPSSGPDDAALWATLFPAVVSASRTRVLATSTATSRNAVTNAAGCPTSGSSHLVSPVIQKPRDAVFQRPTIVEQAERDDFRRRSGNQLGQIEQCASVARRVPETQYVIVGRLPARTCRCELSRCTSGWGQNNASTTRCTRQINWCRPTAWEHSCTSTSANAA